MSELLETIVIVAYLTLAYLSVAYLVMLQDLMNIGNPYRDYDEGPGIIRQPKSGELRGVYYTKQLVRALPWPLYLIYWIIRWAAKWLRRLPQWFMEPMEGNDA